MMLIAFSMSSFFSCRHCFERPPPGSDFYALPLPWGALQRRAYACPAWRVMSIAPAGSPSNSVHTKKKSGQAAHPQLQEEKKNKEAGGKCGWGVLSLSYQTLFLCLSLSPSLLIYLCLTPSVLFFFYFILFCLLEPNHSNFSECLTLFAWHVVEREPGQNNQS